jgi:hypothetical protein
MKNKIRSKKKSKIPRFVIGLISFFIITFTYYMGVLYIPFTSYGKDILIKNTNANQGFFF